MPPRIPRVPLRLRLHLPSASPAFVRLLSTTVPARAAAAAIRAQLPADYIPASQPPSARRPEKRDAQLIRSYASLLRSTPLMLFFQHNNLTAVEWIAVRRELRAALDKVLPPAGTSVGDDVGADVRMEVLRVKMFDQALKITEFFDPEAAGASEDTARTARHGPLVHDLSSAAYDAARAVKEEAPPGSAYGELAPLMTGPVAALVFPAVSPAHLAACLALLAPSPAFPAPTRRRAPGLHEPIVQNALAKILLIGGRVEGKVFDGEGVRWVGGIQGGMDGLRASLVGMLQGVGMGLTGALEAAPKSVWFALEGRKMQLEEEGKNDEEKTGEKTEEKTEKTEEKTEKTEEKKEE